MSKENSMIGRIRILATLVTEDYLGFCLLVTIAMTLGFLLNQTRNMPLPLLYQTKKERLEESVSRLSASQAVTSAVAAVLPERLPESLSLEQFEELVQNKKALILDARPELFHRLGHVPGALALPRDEFEIYYSKIKQQLEHDKGQALVIYCSGSSCEDSGLVAESLKKLGFTQIAVFHGGWDEWTHAGLSQEKNP